MFKPEIVQTLGVSETSVTVKPEVAVAPEAKVVDALMPVGCAKLMVCGVSDETAKFWVTGAAAPYELLPAWVAVIEQVPEAPAKITMFKPETVQTPGVFEVSVTVKPEVAVAPDAMVWFGAFEPGLLKVIVWAFGTTFAVNVAVDENARPS